MAVQASKSVTLTEVDSGEVIYVSAENIFHFYATGTDSIVRFKTRSGEILTKTFNEPVATVNTAAGRTQALTLTDLGTVLYLNSDKIIYMSDNGAGTNIIYDNEGTYPTSYDVDETVANTNTAAGNTFLVTTQKDNGNEATTLYINNLLVKNIEADGVQEAATLLLEMKVESATVTAPGTGYTTSTQVTVTGGGGSGATATNSLKAVSATIAAAGTGYLPADTITLTGGTSATDAILDVATTKVVSATIDNAGAGGTPGAAVVTGTTGTGTKFTANVTIGGGGTISSVDSIATGGSYTVEPTVIAAEPVTGGGLTGAQLDVTMGVDTLTVNTAGDYSVVPSNPVAQGATSGAGTGATATTLWGILAITITAEGTGYTTLPTIAFSGGTGAAANAVMKVDEVVVVDGGTEYDTAPTLAFVGGGGAAAAATVSINLNGEVSSVAVTNEGTGYTSFPTLTLSGGGGAKIVYDDKILSENVIPTQQAATALQSTINGL